MDMNSRKLDTKKREQGDWVSDIPEWGDLRLKVRGIGNADYRRLQSKLIEAVPRQKRQRGVIDPDEQDRITSRLLLNTVLLDWENVTEDGEQVPFSRETAERYLTEPGYEPFRDAVAWAARVVAERAADDEEDVLGNSQNASGGASPGGQETAREATSTPSGATTSRSRKSI